MINYQMEEKLYFLKEGRKEYKEQNKWKQQRKGKIDKFSLVTQVILLFYVWEELF